VQGAAGAIGATGAGVGAAVTGAAVATGLGLGLNEVVMTTDGLGLGLGLAAEEAMGRLGLGARTATGREGFAWNSTTCGFALTLDAAVAFEAAAARTMPSSIPLPTTE